MLDVFSKLQNPGDYSQIRTINGVNDKKYFLLACYKNLYKTIKRSNYDFLHVILGKV